MSKSERKTIFNILGLYFISTFLIITAFSYSYYITEKEKLTHTIENDLFQKSKAIFEYLGEEHNKLQKKITYPRHQEFKSAIYDVDKNYIFGTLTKQAIDFNQKIYFENGYSYYIFQTPQYYLGAAYILIQQPSVPIVEKIVKNMAPVLIFIVIIIIITSLFLVRLLLKPIRDNLKLLDRFIQDATHELNTPISTILTNIELIQSKELSYEKLLRKISRIKSASLTISNLYEDLVYLSLNHQEPSNDTMININSIINERVEYFTPLFQSKSIHISIEKKEESLIYIDKNKLERVLDNLLSNAIKYSQKNSQITIIIKHNSFTVCDQGEGMNTMQIEKISERYTRFNTTQGGFGIGFNIINNIANEYQLKIGIESKLKEGTCVTIGW